VNANLVTGNLNADLWPEKSNHRTDVMLAGILAQYMEDTGNEQDGELGHEWRSSPSLLATRS
jgi:hypothetical protein